MILLILGRVYVGDVNCLNESFNRSLGRMFFWWWLPRLPMAERVLCDGVLLASIVVFLPDLSGVRVLLPLWRDYMFGLMLPQLLRARGLSTCVFSGRPL